MKVFIVHNDVPHEFGECWGVFGSREGAEKYIATFTPEARQYLTIEEWEVKEP